MQSRVARGATTVAGDATPEQVLKATRPVHNAGRGECLFYSFMYHLAQRGQYFPGPQALRKAAVDYALSHWTRYKDFALDPVTLEGFSSRRAFAERFLQPGVYGDHVILHALCRRFHVAAYVVVIGADGKPSEPVKTCRHPGWPIFPYRYEGFHYEALAAA
jgi:hypothetical protein